MILQGVGHQISCIGVCYANDPKKGGYTMPAPALDLTTSLRSDFPMPSIPLGAFLGGVLTNMSRQGLLTVWYLRSSCNQHSELQGVGVGVGTLQRMVVADQTSSEGIPSESDTKECSGQKTPAGPFSHTMGQSKSDRCCGHRQDTGSRPSPPHPAPWPPVPTDAMHRCTGSAHGMCRAMKRETTTCHPVRPRLSGCGGHRRAQWWPQFSGCRSPGIGCRGRCIYKENHGDWVLGGGGALRLREYTSWYPPNSDV